MTMPRVHAMMIARNEADRHLPDVLRALEDLDIVDTFHAIDDGSTDSTGDMLDNCGIPSSVYRSDYSMFQEDGEGVARQKLWDMVSQEAQDGEWIISIDADEVINPGPKFYDLLENSTKTALMVRFYHMWSQTHYRVDKMWKPTLSPRIFRYKSNGIFKNRKLASGAEPTYVTQAVLRYDIEHNTGIRFKHLGYVRDQDKKRKHEFYLKMDNGAFHNIRHLESIVDDPSNVTLEPWE